MSQQPHVFEFSANPGLHFVAMNYSLGQELHGDFVAGNGVDGHYSACLDRGQEMERLQHTLDLSEGSLRDVVYHRVHPQLRGLELLDESVATLHGHYAGKEKRRLII